MEEIMKFNLIEGDPEDYWEKYEQFIKLYNNNEIKVTEIKKQLNLTNGEYRRYRRHAIKENRLDIDTRNPNYQSLVGRPKKQKPPVKNYSRSGGRFYVSKNINGERISFGGYSSERIAKQIVSKLKECNWDKTQLHRIQKEVMNHG